MVEPTEEHHMGHLSDKKLDGDHPAANASKHARLDDQGKRTKAGTGKDIAQEKIGGQWAFAKKPQFLKERVEYFDNLLKAQQEEFAKLPSQKITITLPDGNTKEGDAFKTSPYDVARMISKQLAEKIIVCKVRYPDGRIATLDEGLINPEATAETVGEGWMQWDATRPLEGNAHIELFTFDQPEGKECFWHSSAHVLGETLENEFGVQLCHGPPTDTGFFYDSYTGKDIFGEKHYKAIEDAAKSVVSQSQTFHRLILSKEQALELFRHNPFKVSLISNKIADGGKVTAYKCGDLIDLCTGPHIPSTKMVKAFKVMKNSSAYWLGDAQNDSLQRIYGVSFPSKKELDEYIHFKEEAEKRDHRTIGRQQKLFDTHEYSPGSSFFYPNGMKIYEKLISMIKDQYKIRGYHEVLSPNIFNLKLWKTSGHYQAYKENIFAWQIEAQGFGMKPMNCPGHCLIFDHEIRSYRDLPLRLAEFGVLHRNEISGALSGLTRVRRFVQDDAHLFCTMDQIEEEVLGCLDFLDYIYKIFGFSFELQLSTRPEERLGSEEEWDKAEDALAKALDRFGRPWTYNHGDGAFYGPKIDIKVYDALRRQHQCGTVQCDFQLPIRFNLQYQAENAAEEQAHAHDAENQNKEKKELKKQVFGKDELDDKEFIWREHELKPGFRRPVIIHRAILGSIERFTAILIEHLGGKWPFFLSPRQIIVLPISEKAADYCESVYKYLHKKGFECTVDRSSGQINKKVRNAQLAQWNYILVAGEEEMQSGTVDVRTRDTERHGKMRVDQLAEMLLNLRPDESSKAKDFYDKVWNVEDYKHLPAPEVKQIEEKKEGGIGEVKKEFASKQPAKKEKAPKEKAPKEKKEKAAPKDKVAKPASNEKEQTFIMIKPDGVQRGLIGKIIQRFEKRGFKLSALKVCAPGKAHLEEHYADLSKKAFFPGLIEYMSSGPVCAMVWSGDHSVAIGRKMLGATKPQDSAPGTIRGDFCIDVGRNICHGSDSVESAQKEIKLWFKEGEVTSYKHHSQGWVYE